MMGDTLSIKVYQALASAIDIAAEKDASRKIILSDNGNFPSDLYMAEGLIAYLDRGYQLKVVNRKRWKPPSTRRLPSPC